MQRRFRGRRSLAARFGPILAATLLVAGCARDAGDWRAAASADTPEAYEAFLQKHPRSAHAADAQVRAKELIEKRAWSLATNTDTPEAYRAFLQSHPDGAWAQEARVRIASFEVAQSASGGEPSARAASTAPSPSPSPSPPPAARPVASGPAVASRTARPTAARVQLGALSSRERAAAEWQRLRNRFGPLEALEADIVEADTAVGRMYRLQARVPSGTDPRALCESLKAGGQPCLVVPAR